MKNTLNTRLKMALLLQSGESGFAIVIAISLGLIMIMVGLTMIMRSQNDQIVATNQKQTEESVAIAEKGVAYYQSFLNSTGLYRRLAIYNDCRNPSPRGVGQACNDTNNQLSWSNARNIPGFSTSCTWGSSGGQGGIPSSTDWRDVDDPTNTTTPGIRQFRLVSYLYYPPVIANVNPGLGRLTIEGRVVDRPGSNIAKSITRLDVDIPVAPGNIANRPVPGVWVSGASDTDGTDRNVIAGDVMVNNCNLSGSGRTNMEANIRQPSQLILSDIPMPTLAEADLLSGRAGSPRQISAAPDPLNPPTPTTGDNPADSRFDRAGFIDLGTISSNITLPNNEETRTPALRVADGRYRTSVSGKADVHVYRISGIDGNGNTTVTIRPGARVAFYLYGNIERNVTIQCNPNLAPQPQSADSVRNYNTTAMNATPGRCNPLDIMIFGMNNTGRICINGGRVIEGFIFAPTYTVGVNGGGNPARGNYVGSVWANQWGEGNGCTSNASGTNQTHVLQAGDWNDLPTFARGRISQQNPPTITPSTWRKQVVN